jgi:uncharacterized protein
MGAQIARLVAGADPLELGPAPGAARVRGTVLLDRVHANLLAAAAQMRIGDSGAEGRMLARYACEVSEDAPEHNVCRSIAALLERCERYIDDERERPRVPHATGYPLVIAGMSLARTPDVALPTADALAGS